MCSPKHNESATRGVVRGPAIVVLKEDTTHVLRAEMAELCADVLTATTTRFGTRSWPMDQVKVVKWVKS